MLNATDWFTDPQVRVEDGVVFINGQVESDELKEWAGDLARNTQHVKWLKMCDHLPWRRPIASLNDLLSSPAWRQDHNGFSRQDPGFIAHVINTRVEVIRVYLPPDANTLLSVTDQCLRHRNDVLASNTQKPTGGSSPTQ